jgi:hypothetical protein
MNFPQKHSQHFIFRLLVALGVLCATFLMISCGGGGGGGGGELEPALLRLELTSNSIDTGDFLGLKLDISEVNENGIILKFRYPTGLTYVPGSATLRVNGNPQAITVTPTVNSGSNGKIYLVYFLSVALFGDDLDGELNLRLKAIGAVEDGVIEVDADQDDPSIADNQEFDIESPDFSAVEMRDIEVNDDSGTVSGTPTATPNS